MVITDNENYDYYARQTDGQRSTVTNKEIKKETTFSVTVTQIYFQHEQKGDGMQVNGICNGVRNAKLSESNGMSAETTGHSIQTETRIRGRR